MVNVSDSGGSGPGSSPGWGHCAVFLGLTVPQSPPGELNTGE